MQRKPYEKPKVSKIEVEAQIIRMVTKKGFCEVFWEELIIQRRENPKVSEKKVFDDLNDKWLKVFGEFRYSSYDSFRQRLNK